ncbi:MAG TPA: sensor histidine kinase [Trebonia sp.]|nr:sensor histidine kinase [Trebonia sp.]
MRNPAERPEREFLHSALITDSDESVRQLLAPAVRRALSEADQVFMVVSEDTGRLVQEELGAAADPLRWADTSAFYQRLGFAYEGFRGLLAAAQDGGHAIHVFAEPEVAGQAGDPGAVDRTVAYLPYEAMCNETYARYGGEVTCLWDAQRHSSVIIDSVRSVHSHEVVAGGRKPSRGYTGAREYVAGHDEMPLPLPVRVDWSAGLMTADGLPPLRQGLRDWARQHGFTSPGVADVMLAVNEVATNGVLHGEPPVAVYAWRHRDTLIVQSDDSGGIPIPPAAGYEPPVPGRYGSRGLWLARQLADVVQTHTAGGRTSVRLFFPRELTNRHPGRAAELLF